MKKHLPLFLAAVSAACAAASSHLPRRRDPEDNKQTFWCIRADVVRKLDRGGPERLCGFYGLILAS
jgi:hypothetical protein